MDESQLGFDRSKYFLGALCKNRHDYEGSGKSLVYLKNKSLCLQCDKERAKRNRDQRAAERKQLEQIELERRKTLLIEASVDIQCYALGVLCIHGHEWQETGLSLRYAKSSKCVECHRANKREYYHVNSEARLAYRTTYYAANQPRLLEQKKDYYQRNRDRKLAKDKEYRLANIDKIRNRNKRWYERNKNRVAAYNKIRYEQNRDQILEYKRRYSKQNRDKMRLKWNRWRSTPNGRASDNRSKAKRKILRLANHHADFPLELWAERVAEFNSHCAYCNKSLSKPHMDHFIPVSMGGSHALGNLIPCCQSCNSSKRNFDPKTWYEKQPFYSKSRWRKILKVLGKTDTTYNQIPLI